MTIIERRADPPRWLIVLMATACGLTVANLYYAQPLLSELRNTFHVSAVTAGELVTFSQLGYALGLVFVVPLGDRLEKRHLISVLLAITTLTLIVQGTATTFAMLLVGTILCAPTLVVAQVLVPLAAELSPDESRGRIVGNVMSGLLTGILLSRALGSLLADATNWRVVFLTSAALMAALAVVLHFTLPQGARSPGIPYTELLRSTARMLRIYPQVRRRALYQAAMFGAFSTFWTTISFILTAPPFNYSQRSIGLFALVGAAGALSAPIAGRLADRGYGRATTGFAFVLVILGFAIAGVARHSIFGLAIAAVILDMGVQLSAIVGQHIIYGLDPKARARINSAYIATFFVGGAMGSQGGSIAYHSGGWTAVVILGGVLPLLALAFWLMETNES